ncbi:lysM and putative peptidoglycan-binding domain-containing protein 4 [Amia ocellicauda]|uniref:lysM and putative peptidoglycan-binding domain-containing protein 4 n=1 Tax=Amia ocellicauda TaxID=2972642 RepID=UPI0034640556|nr:LYSM4 protein [Amia calva]
MMLHRETFPTAFQAPVQVHASEEGQVYLFNGREADWSESSEEECNVIELRPRGRESARPGRERTWDLVLLERNISPCDNLNKLALQYGCKVADIKRVNNLIREQDLYALKSIKIPVKKHGLLTEDNTQLYKPQPGFSTGASHSPSPLSPAAANARLDIPDYTDFLKEIDHDLERLIQATDTLDDVSPLDSQGVPPQAPGSHAPANNGADWGIQWWNAVLVMLLIGIILPIFYMVYYKTQDNGASNLKTGLMNHSTSTSSSSEHNFSTALTGKGLDTRKNTSQHPNKDHFYNDSERTLKLNNT